MAISGDLHIHQSLEAYAGSVIEKNRKEAFMNHFCQLFNSPELYPLRVDFRRQVVNFVRMSPETYLSSVFLDGRTHRLGSNSYDVRIDDLLLAAESMPFEANVVHYILHPTFCCSTLLARYFELLPSCFVLKEPVLLTQLALTSRSSRGWREAFELCGKLLARTYTPGQFVVIKPHEPCNILGADLLRQNARVTITFLRTPLRDFLLAILKAKERRAWVKRRIPQVQQSVTVPSLAHVDTSWLQDAEAAAYLWMVNHFLCHQLSSGEYRSRVLVLDGERVAESPEESLRAVSGAFGLFLTDEQVHWMVKHPSAGRYSKDLSKPYDAISRRKERAELEDSWGAEADLGMEFCASHASGALHVGESWQDAKVS